MLDTKNFVSKAGVRTFEAAAYLRRLGAETSEVKKFFNTSLGEYQQKVKLVAGAELYRGCAISSTNQTMDDINIVVAQAADELLNINGVKASFVMYEAGKGGQLLGPLLRRHECPDRHGIPRRRRAPDDGRSPAAGTARWRPPGRSSSTPSTTI